MAEEAAQKGLGPAVLPEIHGGGGCYPNSIVSLVLRLNVFIYYANSPGLYKTLYTFHTVLDAFISEKLLPHIFRIKHVLQSSPNGVIFGWWKHHAE